LFVNGVAVGVGLGYLIATTAITAPTTSTTRTQGKAFRQPGFRTGSRCSKIVSALMPTSE